MPVKSGRARRIWVHCHPSMGRISKKSPLEAEACLTGTRSPEFKLCVSKLHFSKKCNSTNSQITAVFFLVFLVWKQKFHGWKSERKNPTSVIEAIFYVVVDGLWRWLLPWLAGIDDSLFLEGGELKLSKERKKFWHFKNLEKKRCLKQWKNVAGKKETINKNSFCGQKKQIHAFNFKAFKKTQNSCLAK